jgi:sugar O-acyltransferase (sialic acid O-acetyltransferase NeuD family)
VSASDLGGTTGNESLFVIGAGGHAKSIAEVAIAAGFTIEAFISPSEGDSEFMGIRVLRSLPEDIAVRTESIAIGIGANYLREKVMLELQGSCQPSRFPALIHPSAIIASSAQIDMGTTIHQNAVVGPSSRIGKFCTVNTSATIDHDSVMEDFSSMGPGAHTGGGVTIGKRAHISIGAIAIHGIEIGSDSILGAGSCATESIPELTVSVGTPARVLKQRLINDPYL